MNAVTIPTTPQQGHEFIKTHHLRFCEADEIKELMLSGESFIEACNTVAMQWLKGEEKEAKNCESQCEYYQCSIEFSQFLHFLEEADIFSIESELWKRACKLHGF